MVTKLEVFQIAIRHLGATKLHETNGLTEDRKDRRALDAVYEQSNKLMLESGLWKFATRTVLAEPDAGITPEFGPTYVYPHPDDWVALVKISSDPNFYSEVDFFDNDNSAISCNLSQLYLKYISNDDAYGWNLGAMTARYAEAWGCLMALMTNLPVTGQKDGQSYLEGKHSELLTLAKQKDAFDQRVQRKPAGRWSQSRAQRSGSVIIANGRMRWWG